MTSYYLIERKTLRWYKKIGIHCIRLLLINFYYLYNKYEKRISLYDYRLSVIEELLQNYHNVPDNIEIKKKIMKYITQQKCKKMTKKNTNTNDVKFVPGKIRYIIVFNAKNNLVYVSKVVLKSSLHGVLYF